MDCSEEITVVKEEQVIAKVVMYVGLAAFFLLGPLTAAKFDEYYSNPKEVRQAYHNPSQTEDLRKAYNNRSGKNDFDNSLIKITLDNTHGECKGRLGLSALSLLVSGLGFFFVRNRKRKLGCLEERD